MVSAPLPKQFLSRNLLLQAVPSVLSGRPEDGLARRRDGIGPMGTLLLCRSSRERVRGSEQSLERPSWGAPHALAGDGTVAQRQQPNYPKGAFCASFGLLQHVWSFRYPPRLKLPRLSQKRRNAPRWLIKECLSGNCRSRSLRKRKNRDNWPVISLHPSLDGLRPAFTGATLSRRGCARLLNH
jgi:hypothetical protein